MFPNLSKVPAEQVHYIKNPVHEKTKRTINVHADGLQTLLRNLWKGVPTFLTAPFSDIEAALDFCSIIEPKTSICCDLEWYGGCALEFCIGVIPWVLLQCVSISRSTPKLKKRDLICCLSIVNLKINIIRNKWIFVPISYTVVFLIHSVWLWSVNVFLLLLRALYAYGFTAWLVIAQLIIFNNLNCFALCNPTQHSWLHSQSCPSTHSCAFFAFGFDFSGV